MCASDVLCSAVVRPRKPWSRAVCLTVIVMAASRCGNVNAGLERLSEARDRSADLIIQFTKAADASDRAVMADTDELSVAFAREADQARQNVQNDLDVLGPMLEALGYAGETRLFQEFTGRYKAYTELDRQILELAVENTNLKAQRLSFGPAQEAADAFRDSIQSLSPADPAGAWHVKALAVTAIASVRDIQSLQAPHIADPDDAAMTRFEQRMASSESAARAALEALPGLIDPPSRPRLAAAGAALDRFMSIHAQILVLSHRNTNVRSLAMSLDQKRKLVGPCEESLHALRDALAKRGYPKGR